MGTNILFWNCQGIRPKRKELELYQKKENIIYVIALNETFLSKKHNFKIPGYDTVRNDRSAGQGGGVAFLVTWAAEPGGGAVPPSFCQIFAKSPFFVSNFGISMPTAPSRSS